MGDTNRRWVRGRARRRSFGVVVAAAMVAGMLPATAAFAQQPPLDPSDPRVGLAPGYLDGEAGEAALGLEHLANIPKPGQFNDGATAPVSTSGINQANSDLAFSGDVAFMGNYTGWTAYDISDPAEPELLASVVCPGGQGDVSVLGDLLFVSVEQTTSRVDCSTDTEQTVFRGVRIFDVSSVLAGGDGSDVVQVAAVQTCRGSHTHTLVQDPDDDTTVYVYNSGTNQPRGDQPTAGDLGCANPAPGTDDFNEDSSRFMVEVIEVSIAAPEDAEVVNEVRLFATGAGDDYRIDGLQQQGSQGQGYQTVAQTDACHDITAYPEIGLAAGACEGNGILIDITDPENPERIDEVADRNFAYWHSATFSNDGSKIVFTDEWGGGTGARCLATDRPQWGANAIFDVLDTEDGPRMQFAQYYKLPAPQTVNENCVAHNGTLVPVPGRDVMVQAWYQGGISLWDFTDSSSPFEIGYFDRGPTSDTGTSANLGGYWSAYWYDGAIYGSEIVRGFDTFTLTETDWLSQAEIDRAEAVSYGGDFNAQMQLSYDVEPLPEPPEACDQVEPVSFPDVAGRHADNVSCVAGFGVARGFPDGMFRPGVEVRRDQMASFLERMLEVGGIELPEPSSPHFTDVPAANEHGDAIERLAEAGIVNGVGEGSYDPRGTVTRAQMASFLVRTVEFALDEDLSASRAPFTDVPSSSTHAANIDVAYAIGITDGTTATTFSPGVVLLRGQMGSFLANTLDVMDGFGIELTPLPVD